jgi:RNA polymerase sigma-B factor
MRDADLTDGRRGRELSYAGDRWRPLAQQLAARFAAAGGSDEGMIRAAVDVILDVERRLGSRGPECSSLVVPLVIRALRRHRREQFRRPESASPFPALQVAIAAAEGELCTRLRRSPTVDEVASHLHVSEHQVIAGLEAGWSAGSSVVAAG